MIESTWMAVGIGKNQLFLLIKLASIYISGLKLKQLLRLQNFGFQSLNFKGSTVLYPIGNYLVKASYNFKERFK